jgi:hypothetical protein
MAYDLAHGLVARGYRGSAVLRGLPDFVEGILDVADGAVPGDVLQGKQRRCQMAKENKKINYYLRADMYK